MPWYYHLNDNTQGPLEAPEMQGLLQRGVITRETPVWTEGMAQWEALERTPLSTTRPAPAGMQICAGCGKASPEPEMLHYENSWVCAACKPLFFQRIQEGVIPRGTLELSGIGKRFLAVFIDGILLAIVLGILLLPIFIPMFHDIAAQAAARHAGDPPVAPTFSIGMRLYMYLVEYGLPAAYEIFFIGAFGATLGKMLMKIKVVSPEGAPISYARATGRHFSKLLSGLILYIGYLMAFWDDEKRALHDRICKTRVVVSGS